MVASLRDVYGDWPDEGGVSSDSSAGSQQYEHKPRRRRNGKKCGTSELDTPIKEESNPIVEEPWVRLPQGIVPVMPVPPKMDGQVPPGLFYLIALLLVANLIVSMRISAKLDRD